MSESGNIPLCSLGGEIGRKASIATSRPPIQGELVGIDGLGTPLS